MSQQPFAGRAADLIAGQPNAGIANLDIWERDAEDCVLARIRSMRLIGGLPRHKAPLGASERVRRLQQLLRLWANGCTSAVDEDLFADLLNRHRW